MTKDREDLDVTDLGVASELTQGLAAGVNESIGRQKPAGISDED